MLGVLNAATASALLVMLAAGLALIFGLRRVMNFAHGAIYMVGAYLGYSLSTALGFWPALVLVPVILGLAGIAAEYLMLRPLRKRSELDVALITYGLSLVIGQIIIKIYGGNALTSPMPSGLRRSVGWFGVEYPAYRLLIILVGLGSVVAVFGWLRWTRSGMYVRAVSNDPDTARMVGVNSKQLGLFVVCLSTAFAGLAGVLAGPYTAVQPGMGDAIIVSSLMIIAIGGLGSIGGAIVAAVLFGVASSVGQQYVPSIASLFPYILLIVVLAVRPQGFGGRKAA